MRTLTSALFLSMWMAVRRNCELYSQTESVQCHNVKKRKFGATANGRALVRLAKNGHIPECEPTSSMRFFAQCNAVDGKRCVNAIPSKPLLSDGTSKLLKSIFKSAADPNYDSKTHQSLSDVQLVQKFLPAEKYYGVLDELFVFDQGGGGGR